MLENITNLGVVLTDVEQKNIEGGFSICDTVPLPAIYKAFCELPGL